MSGRPATGRCEKHDRIRCLQCWKDAENASAPPALNAAQVPTDSVRARLSAERPTPQPPPFSPKPGAPPADIEGFDVGGPPNIAETKAPVLNGTISLVEKTIPSVEKGTESPEIVEFVAAARRRAIAGQNLAALEKAIKSAKAEKKIAYAEFRRLMNPPRVRKPRKARASLADSTKE